MVDDIAFSDAIDEVWESIQDWILWGLDRSRIELQLATSGSFGTTSNLHDKFVIVDAERVLITGANVQAENDGPIPWHDTGYVLAGDVAISALSAFEQVWYLDPSWPYYRDGTRFWTCNEEIDPACHRRARFPDADRSWFPSRAQSFGGVPVIAAGKIHTYPDIIPAEGSDQPEGTVPVPDAATSETNTPQAIAWLTAMEMAQESIHVETPNINATPFVDAVVDAVGRGVNVRLITSLGFNHLSANFTGGDNQEVVGDIRQAIREQYPNQQEGFEMRWYSRDGLEPVERGDSGGQPHQVHDRRWRGGDRRLR